MNNGYESIRTLPWPEREGDLGESPADGKSLSV